jgi:hypothetical protein
MNHRIGRFAFALAVGVLVAVSAYRWITDSSPRLERELEAAAVSAARAALVATVAAGDLEIVDPLAPDRAVGKAYVYREGPGWQVSGYYRRGSGDPWHPYLATLGEDQELVHLKLSDRTLLERGGESPRLTVLP